MRDVWETALRTYLAGLGLALLAGMLVGVAAALFY